MGNIFFCEPEPPKDESVINLSESCINRLSTDSCDSKGDDKSKLPPSSHMVVTENRWMTRLSKMEDCHSCRRQLSEKEIDDFFNKIEDHIGDVGKEFCPFDEVLTCLKENDNSMVTCSQILDDFIDCVDTVRIERTKRSYELESNSETKKAENN